MDQLFTPWRLEYIVGKREEGCIFCKKPLEKGRERDNLVLHAGANAFVMLNRFPYNPGHLMVAPLRHTSDLECLTTDENLEIATLLQKSVTALRQLYHPEGYNLGLNLGQAAGAGILDHIHWHIVPRWVGDTNFMPVLSETRMIPQLLEEAWDLLHPLFSQKEAD